jgi:hypothetical protein
MKKPRSALWLKFPAQSRDETAEKTGTLSALIGSESARRSR